MLGICANQLLMLRGDTNRRRLQTFAIGCLLALTAHKASAEIVQYKMTGQITVDWHIGTLPDGIYDGAPFEARLSYDTDTPEHPLFADDPQRGLYPTEEGPHNFLILRAGPAEIHANALWLWVANDIEGSPHVGDGRPIWDLPDDSFQMNNSQITANFPLTTFNSIVFRWRDPSRTAFDSNRLPIGIEFDLFEDKWFEVLSHMPNSRPDQFRFRAIVTDVSAISEPSAATLGIVGLLLAGVDVTCRRLRQRWKRLLPITFGSLAACLAVATADAATRYSIVALEPLPGGIDSYATAINENGVVVGHSTLDRSGNIGRSRPVMWDSSGRPTLLWEEGPSAPAAIPAAINNAGHVVGQYHIGSGIPLPSTDLKLGRAFIWDAENGIRDLGSLGGSRVEATGINEIGRVAGSSYLANRQGIHAFIWDETNGMRSLGTLGGVVSRAAEINNHGQIAGTSWLADDNERAFLWDADAGMRDLGTLGGNLSRGAAINDKGDVVGFSSIDAGFGGAFLGTS